MEFEAAFLLVAILFFFFFFFVLIGYYIDITNFVNVPQLYPQDVNHDPELLKKIAYIYMAFGLIFYLLLVRSALGGELFFLFTTTEARSEVFSGSAHLRLGSQLLYIGYTVWLISILTNQQKPKVWHLLPAIPILFLFLLLGGRGHVIGIALAIIMILYYALLFNIIPIKTSGITFVKDKFHFYAKMAIIPIIGVGMIFAALITGRLRQAEIMEEAIADIDIIRILTAGVANDVPDNLIATIETVPEEFGFYYGTLVFRVILNWIPRGIWPDKPVLTTGSELRRVILPERSGGRPPGEIGRFYVDLGYPGIIIGAILTGLVMRYIYELLRKNGHSPVFLLVYAVSLFAIAGGPTNNALWSLTSTLVLLTPLLIADWWSRNKSNRNYQRC